MVSVAEALAQGTRHHQAGQLAEAERIYRQVLAVEPDNTHALHFMGVLALQARQFAAAVDLIGRAIRIDRSQAAFHANLGEAHRQLGALPKAVECFRAAIKLQPELAQAHGMLGGALWAQGHHDEAAAALREALRLKPEDSQARARLGQVLVDQGKFGEAEICFRRVLRTEERSAEAHFHLANVLQSQDKLDLAAVSYRNALALDPAYADAHNNLGTILKNQKALDEAIAHFQAALRIQPNHVAAHTNLALAYDSQDQFEAAAQSYRAASQADPRSVEARYRFAVMLERQSQADSALAWYEEALRIDPDYVAAHIGMSNCLRSQGRLVAARAYCERAIRIDPGNAEAYNSLGVAWNEQGMRDEAIACFRRAIELRSDNAIAHSNLGIALQAVGRLDECIAEHRQAVALAADNPGLHSNLLYALNYHPAYDAAALFAEHLAWGQRHAESLFTKSASHEPERTSGRRLRVGYASAHFLAHAVNFFSEPILATHDHAKFEVFCYSDVDRADETTDRLRGLADHWRETFTLTDQQLHDLVRQDRIDILVDLTGHINGGKRMLVFARKAAPIQVTYIGYQNTTGMAAMDYRLTDAYADPPGATDDFYTERLVRLHQTFFCYQPSSDAPAVNLLPALSAGYVTFGSINNFAKVTGEVLQAWGAILQALPQSRLVILGDMADSLRRSIERSFESQGVGRERLELVNRVPRSEYLELISRVDVALDPFPFNGHTTTCDCLWQGVPVVTLSGETYVSRFGGSGLATLGLGELIARTSSQYVEIAIGLAGDRQRLAQLRSTLRERMAASPLLDFQSFTRNLEGEYQRMWRDWCAGHAG
jgi:predicted O-linked N-acetylglucosamine transferase (SPINDLY family)